MSRRLLGIGGTLRPGSSSELALRYTLDVAAGLGATTELLTARELQLPLYDPETADDSADALRLIDAVRSADQLIIATPGYHGGMSGLLKNALDYLQALSDDPVPYLHDRPVGCIVTAAGWQAGATALGTLRGTVHALRGWPTPLGVSINSTHTRFSPTGEPLDTQVAGQLTELARQVLRFSAIPIV